MEKRAQLRQFYSEQSKSQEEAARFEKQAEQAKSLEKVLFNSFQSLVSVLEGQGTKAETIALIVRALDELDKQSSDNTTEVQMIKAGLKTLEKQISDIPTDSLKKIPKFLQQREEVKVSNLSDLSSILERVESAIKSLELNVEAPNINVPAPRVQVDAPIINVPETDLTPLVKTMREVVESVKSIEFPSIPETDLKKLEKESKEHTKLLQKIVDKPAGGGGGGGGNGTPYLNSSAKASYVTLESDGSIPVTVKSGGSGSSSVEITNTTLPLPTGAATEATLASVIKQEDSPAVSGDSGIPLLAMRQLADTTSTDSDNDYTLLKIDEEGRLKVATKPASYTATTGNITMNGGIVWINCARASNIVFSMVATSLVGHAASFEVSNNTTNGSDGTWYSMQAVRSNANTIETTTGTLAATPAYGWEVSVNGWNAFRVRATAHTSGTAAYILQPGSYATEPIPAAQVSATQAVSGTVTITNPNGTNYNVVTTASTNAANIKNSAGTLYEITASNPTATAAYVKLYNKSSSPTVGTDVPIMTISVPATSATTMPVALMWGSIGKRFGTGISIAVTAGPLATDTAVAVAGIQVNATYI